MALQTLQFVATIPAGTTAANPFIEQCELDNWEVESIDLDVPIGSNGLMGFAIFNNGAQFVPRTAGTWFVWNDRQQTIPVTGYPNASGWAIHGYNTGQFPHAVTVRFHVNPPETPTPPTPSLPTFITTPVESEPIVL